MGAFTFCSRMPLLSPTLRIVRGLEPALGMHFMRTPFPPPNWLAHEYFYSILLSYAILYISCKWSQFNYPVGRSTGWKYRQSWQFHRMDVHRWTEFVCWPGWGEFSILLIIWHTWSLVYTFFCSYFYFVFEPKFCLGCFLLVLAVQSRDLVRSYEHSAKSSLLNNLWKDLVTFTINWCWYSI